MWTFWKIKKTPAERKSEAEVKLAQLEQILFPPFTTESMPDGTIFHMDYSADSNLSAALIDLQDGTNDRVTQKTIAKVLKNLEDARKVLEAYPFMDKRAKYVIVDTEKDDEAETNDEF